MSDLKDTARRVIRAALSAADPRKAVLRTLGLHGVSSRTLSSGARSLRDARPGAVSAIPPRSPSARGDRTEQSHAPRIVCGDHDRPVRGELALVAVGKAAVGMTAGALEALGPLTGRLSSLIIVLPHGYPCDLPPTPAPVTASTLRRARVAPEVLFAGHPLPDEAGLSAARRVAQVIEGMREEDLCLLLLSGGGSSLLPLPAEGISLAEKAATTALLLGSGADIVQMNVVRKHLSAIKGGRLAERCKGSIEALVVSDVVGDRLSFIASGPTVSDPTTFTDALAVLSRFSLLDRVPASVRRHLEGGAAGKTPDTPKRLPDRHRATIIASNRIAVDAAADEAASAGFKPLVLTTSLSGEAREAGRFIASVALEAACTGRPVQPPACVVAGGETTVTLRGAGRGGRNQELALAAALGLEGVEGVLVASFATDGREGNTDAAGGFASGRTAAAGRSAGLDPQACLASNDSHAFLSAAGDLIVTGPTGTNVNDITCALIAPRDG